VVRINPVNNKMDSTSVIFGVNGASFGLLGENLTVQKKISKHVLSISEGWQHSDSYRRQSELNRKYLQVTDRFKYRENSELRILALYADLQYETPGGLTITEFEADPRNARPATKTLPGAESQKAGIINKTAYAGIVNELAITNRLKHVIAIFGSGTKFENPFITNYEIRNEMNAGLRTWLELKNKTTGSLRTVFNIGGEIQNMVSDISNYENNGGIRGPLTVRDNANVFQSFAFARYMLDFNNRLIVEASMSYNYNSFRNTRQFPLISKYRKILAPQMMPRLALSYSINRVIAVRALLSRGYSPPSLQEVRSSNTLVNLGLDAEHGWNYETGIRVRLFNNRLWWDASIFYYNLQDAIVRRLDDAGQEFFINAGQTHQFGLESATRLEILKQHNSRFIRSLELSHAFTFNNFRFGNYNNGVSEITGNRLTGVPQQVSVQSITAQFPFHFYLFAQSNFTGRIPLNDLNTEFARAYHLVLLKAGWKIVTARNRQLDIGVGVDNLLDERYSLGNDLNAAGNRYYNAAPSRNYFFSMKIKV
jgi:iron complex outermembrane receptor protein